MLAPNMKINKQVRKYIQRQSRPDREHLNDILRKFPSVDAKKMEGRDGKIRARLGKYRIIFQYEPDGSPTAIMAGIRGDVYKHLRSRTRRLEEKRRKEMKRYGW